MIFGIDRHPSDMPAIISADGTVWDYGRLVHEVSEFKKVLNGRSLIFCLCRNDAASAAGYLGFLEQGSVSLLLAEKPDPALLSALTDTYKPSYLWRPVADAETETPVYTLDEYGLFATGFESPEMADSLALLLSSSGTTGSPKLIRLSRRNLEANAAAISQYLNLSEKERPVTTLPMHYTYGLSVINSHLYAGACVLMTRASVVNQEFWDFLSAYNGTSLAGVPYTYEILKRIRFTERDDISSITSLTQAGGHLSVELQKFYGKWAADHDIKFFVMYGQTEATARMSYLPPEDMLRKPGSIGIPIPNGRFEILDTDGNIINTPDEAGELVYYGENVSLGYAACRDDLSKPDERGGRLLTGDLASFDYEGYYYIRGRLSRFVKLYGNRVSLDECENILKGLDVDSEFACAGNDDELVIFTDSIKADDAPLYLAERLKLNIRAFRAVKLSRIPTNDRGKVDYAALGDLL